MDSMAKHLFTGTVVADGLHPYPKLTDDEREPVAFLLDAFRKFAREHIDPVKIDKNRPSPRGSFPDWARWGFWA